MGRGAEEEKGRTSLAVGLGFLRIERGSVEKVGVRQVVGRKADAQVLLRHWGLCCRSGCNKGYTEEKGKGCKKPARGGRRLGAAAMKR